jgi:biopolymer transport protein TolR
MKQNSISGVHRRPLMGEINIVPLVDVVMVLLIVFMVTAPLLSHGIDMTLPQTQSNTINPKKQFILTLAADRVIYLNDEVIPTDQLRERLLLLKGQSVYLQADQSIPYGEVMTLIDLMKQVGIDRLGLVTDRPAETAG